MARKFWQQLTAGETAEIAFIKTLLRKTKKQEFIWEKTGSDEYGVSVENGSSFIQIRQFGTTGNGLIFVYGVDTIEKLTVRRCEALVLVLNPIFENFFRAVDREKHRQFLNLFEEIETQIGNWTRKLL